MKSASQESFYLESEEDEEKKLLGENSGNDSDTSDSVPDHLQHSKSTDSTGSTRGAWPQSYRQSMDMYSGTASPIITNIFESSPGLPRFGSSFLSNSLTRRHTPESLSAAEKPLLQKAEDEQVVGLYQKDEKASRVGHEHSVPRRSTNGQAIINGANMMCGIGLLSTAYGLKEGGWLGLPVLFLFSVFSFYTGLLLRRCLDSQPELESFADIGQAAFGTTGRLVIAVILYSELYAACVGYIIMASDNLSSLFPNVNLSLVGLDLSSHIVFALATTLLVLPTVWLRDLSLLSYVSAGGVLAALVMVLCLFWVGLADNVGIHSKGTLLNLGSFPVAVGVYGVCFSGHALFPNIYTSMVEPKTYPVVLFTSIFICTLLYSGSAVMGYWMFGESTESEFTLNMPKDLVASKIATWTTIINPFAKYALTMAPVALSIEELMPSYRWAYSICIRTALVISTLLVALVIPSFGLLLSLIGSISAMFQAFILPCACYLSIARGKITRLQGVLCVTIISVGIVSSVMGTYSTLYEIIQQLTS